MWKGCFIVHLFGNAPICASSVLECSCCRIHRYVAAPLHPCCWAADDRLAGIASLPHFFSPSLTTGRTELFLYLLPSLWLEPLKIQIPKLPSHSFNLPYNIPRAPRYVRIYFLKGLLLENMSSFQSCMYEGTFFVLHILSVRNRVVLLPTAVFECILYSCFAFSESALLSI